MSNAKTVSPVYKPVRFHAITPVVIPGNGTSNLFDTVSTSKFQGVTFTETPDGFEARGVHQDKPFRVRIPKSNIAYIQDALVTPGTSSP